MPPLTPAEHARRREALTNARRPGLPLAEAARHLGLTPTALKSWMLTYARDLMGVNTRAAGPRTDCRVVVWPEQVTRSGLSLGGLTGRYQRRTVAVWSVDCVTCRQAWVADDAADAERIKAAHLAGVAS
ncbi:MAG: hypothetical protein IPJ61_17730 [Tessaracoccus sp.]|uniref:hypothetical protein n=1 Tax=Tessaracoccus sp. TaxID=1971211 RepID=UPI001ED6115F|nr:hypothetical protein [Tessaracoccus sp.]MBK7822845.1 hypothetical protein [Tessaracoccus sp.]